MSNRRKLKRRPGSGRRSRRLRRVAGQGTVGSSRSRRLNAVTPENDDRDAREVRLDVPAFPETSAREIHVLCVSLHDVTPPPYRLLEVPSAMTLDGLHRVLAETFEWWEPGPHSFVTVYGEFFGLKGPVSPAAGRAGEPRDEASVTLAQVAGEEGLGIAYLCGYRDEWRIDIRVEEILPATPGVAYPRCIGGRGEDPGREFGELREFRAQREPFAAGMCFDPEELTEDLAHLATVIIPRP